MTAPVAISVLVDGIAHTVTPTTGDLVRLEREFGISSSSMTAENTGLQEIMFLAYAGLRRTKVIDRELSFDDFLDMADTGEATPADPTPPLPPPSSAE